MVTRRSLAVVLFVLASSFAAADDTPPVVTPNVSGTLGNNGWYTSDVAISWTIVDEESTVFTTTGCEADLLTMDDTARTYTCSATSEGGTTIVSQTISRDTTAPVINYSGNQSTYQLGDEIRIFCEAFDPTSGIASTTCQDISVAALDLTPGVNVFTATATDNAGNTGTGSVSFEVQVTPAGIAALVDRYVTKASVARSLKRSLELAGSSNPVTKARGIEAFTRTVTRETGRSISPEHAATLLRLIALL